MFNKPVQKLFCSIPVKRTPCKLLVADFHLSVGTSQDVLAVDLEPLTPSGHAPHESLRPLPLLLAVEHRVNKLSSRPLSHLDSWLVLRAWRSDTSGAPPHVILAIPQQGLQLLPKPLSTLHEVIQDLPVLWCLDVPEEFPSTLQLGAQLSEKLPQSTSSLCGVVGLSMVVLGPVEDPLSQRVGIKN
jgi:hypothetical protein